MDPRQEHSESRRPLVITLAAILLLLTFLLFSQASLNLDFLQPESLGQTLVFIALSALIFLVFIALTFVLARNLFKLFAERRLGVLGSRFRTRMVLGALVLSFLPSIFLFLFSYVLMNRTIDKWFSRPVEELREDTAQTAQLLRDYASRNAAALTATIATDDQLAQALATADPRTAKAVINRYASPLQGGFVVVMKNDVPLLQWQLPQGWRDHDKFLRERNGSFQLGGSEFSTASHAVGNGGRILVGLPLPRGFATTLASIDRNQRQYYELSQSRRVVRRFYMQLLLLLTVLMMFASTWLSLFIARLVTRPVAALAEATKEISAGNLEYRVQVSAADELGELVGSFNRMAEELENNRRQIETAGRELADKNLALSDANAAVERRRREIETIIENIPTGVLSLDMDRRVTTSNRAFNRLFGGEVRDGTALDTLFENQVAEQLEHLLRRADRMATESRQLELKSRQVEVTAASLDHGAGRAGYVIVFEDLSELLKAQKQLAWREVARRVAHEIKNPLTPIVLSAERIRRHLDRQGVPDGPSLSVIHSCVETISGAVETVRALVDEFSLLARFPAAKPEPSNLNHIVDSALSMFNGRMNGVTIYTDLARNLPKVMADPEGIKRVVANLVDNAAEAMQKSLVREMHVSTSLVPEGEKQMVELVVADTGHGVTAELKEKLFLPYFSTKDRGTGLGLAIVSRIIEEHHGHVRVEENKPVGARFIVELPVA
jgi:two-component system nitrogen regulation sensor histidine kinase NtrY